MRRWLSARAPLDDPQLAETESLLGHVAASGEPMSPQARERMRAATLSAFATQRAAGRDARPARRRPRTLAVALAVAALLVVAGTVAAAESGPGQPFYPLRLTLESLTLPSGGSARTEALLAQLDRRLEEAKQENARGNAGGVADAVHAYQATLDEVSGGIGQGVSQAAVDAALQRHVNVLEEVLRSAPAAAQPGLQRALEHTQQALQHRPTDHGPPTRSSHPGPPQSPPGRQ